MALHMVSVGLECINLAIMCQHAEGLREFPRRECIGRKALMINRRARDETVIFQVGIEIINVFGEEHAFINNGLNGERADVKARNRGRDNEFLNAATDNIKLAL